MSIPTEGTAHCLTCGEHYRSWKREPMNPCQNCGSYNVVWSPEIFRELPDQERMVRQWMNNGGAAQCGE